MVFAAIAIFVALTLWKGIDQLSEASASLEQQIDDLSTRLVAAQATDDMRSELLRLEGNRLTPANIGWISMGLAAGLYGLALICSAMFWYTCLKAFGQSPARRITVAAHVLGQVGKYIPGKAMVVMVRSSALHRHAGTSRVTAAIGVFVETLTMMACGATIAGIAVLLIPAPWWIRVLALGLAVASAIPTLPPLFHKVLSRLARSRFGKMATFEVDRYDWVLMVRGWGWMTMTWLLIGGSFWFVVLATPGGAENLIGLTGFATATATVALAMVAGFLSLVPGGAGVRELVITALLAPLVGTGVAMIAAILARLMFLLVECTASGLSWAYLNSLANVATNPTAIPQSASMP
jgi:glycosyltransferase 2 family protein